MTIVSKKFKVTFNEQQNTAYCDRCGTGKSDVLPDQTFKLFDDANLLHNMDASGNVTLPKGWLVVKEPGKDDKHICASCAAAIWKYP